MTLFLAALAIFAQFAASTAIAAGPPPPIWPDNFSIRFYTQNEESAQYGTMYYSWSQRAQRIDHAQHSYECEHFYSTTGPCTLLFINHSMYAVIPDKQQCCLDLPNGPTPPTWLASASYNGTDTVNGLVCDRWQGGPHFYWEHSGVPVKFSFPDVPAQDMYFLPTTYLVAPQPSSLFTLPATTCSQPCHALFRR
eukprot:m.235241 g.235241  ORF g.235241 m.235241 type:complete len:194 (+) comp19957_c0_seq1:70-651(+)